jgi:hypothetical protein
MSRDFDYYADQNGHAVVLVDEEYGFKRHLWYTEMSPAELESFWKDISNMSIHYMDPTKSLPGRWATAVTGDDIEAWMDALERGRIYYAHIFNNDDSFLRTPDDREILHAGYKEITSG